MTKTFSTAPSSTSKPSRNPKAAKSVRNKTITTKKPVIVTITRRNVKPLALSFGDGAGLDEIEIIGSIAYG